MQQSSYIDTETHKDDPYTEQSFELGREDLQATIYIYNYDETFEEEIFGVFVDFR